MLKLFLLLFGLGLPLPVVAQSNAGGSCYVTCMSCSGPNPDQCTSCATGYIMTSVTGYGPGESNCKSCMEIHRLTGGECTSCSVSSCSSVKCYSGYYKIGNTNCASCSSKHSIKNGTCISCTASSCSSVSCNEGSYNNGTSCPLCDSTCKTCSGGGASACLTCPKGRYLSGGKCQACPSNATCSGGTSASFSCNSGYHKENDGCVRDKTVSSCPARMTESADGRCCINK